MSQSEEGPGSPGPSSLTPRTEHGDYHYEIVARTRAGKERVHEYASDEPLEIGAVLRLAGRFWLIENHELEHAFARREEEELPAAAAAAFARAEAAGLPLELVALEPGEEPDWEEAERYIDALILDELEDDLIELCGVDPAREPRETWLETVKERLLEDLRQFRADLEGDHDEIEEWAFRGGRIFASVGNPGDEADPDSAHGWMCRLVDSSALTAAGFQRVQKARLDVLEP